MGTPILSLMLLATLATAAPPGELPPEAGAVIEVRRADGAPAEGVRVRVAPASAPAAPGEGESPARSALTGIDGRVLLPREPAEELRLQVLPGAGDGAPPTAVFLVVRAGRQELAARLSEAEDGPGGGQALWVTLPSGRPAYGRLLDERGRPVEGAEVALRAAGGVEAAAARSRADGRFAVAALPAGRFDLRAHAPGFAPAELPGMEAGPGRAPVDLGTLALRRGARIEGRVTDAAGTPLEGAEVRHRPAAGRPGREVRDRLLEEPPAAITGTDGRFAVPDLAPGRPLHLLVSRRDFLPAWTLGVEAPSPDPLAVVLEPAATLTGRVVDERGEAVADAAVSLHWRGPPAGQVGLEPRRGDGPRSSVTGPRGGFRFEELAPGEVELSARAPDFLPGEPVAADVPPGGRVADLRLVLRHGAVITGRVEDSAGEPVAGAELRAGPATATSGRTGAYRLAGVPPGVLGLFAHHADYRRVAREVEVEPGVNEVDLVLEDGWSVAGQVVDETGEAVPGARLVLRPESLRNGAGYLATSGPEGRFRAVLSEQGRFDLAATREGYAPRRMQGLEVGPAPLEGVEVVLSRGASVVGHIYGLELDDLATVAVEAREESLGTVAGSVDHRGRYAVHHLLPGDWRIRASVAGGRREARATVVVEAGAERVERDLELGGGFRLTGRLRYRGEPVPGAHVSLDGLDVTAHRSVLTGHDGSFRLDGLEAGRYRLDVLDPSRALSHVQEVELTGDHDLSLDLESSRLDGVVLAADTDEPVEDVVVYVRQVAGGGPDGVASVVTVGTDAAGAFALAHVAPGRYRISTHKDGFVPAERQVEVLAGGTPRSVVLRLEPAGGLTVEVRLASGAVPDLVTVSAFEPSGRQVLTDTKGTSDHGFVLFRKLPPGRWSLLVSAAGAAPEWAVAEVPGALKVTLPPAAPLTLRVPALLETAAAGVVTVATAGGEPFFQVEPGGAIRSRWALDGGRITLADVPAGTWTVRVAAADGQVWEGRVATDGQAPAALTLE